MAEGQGLPGAWSRALEVNARYYETLGKLTATWLRDLADVSAGVRMPTLPQVVQFQAKPPAQHDAAHSGSHRAPAPALLPRAGDDADAVVAAQPSAALVLEAEGGQQAVGAFLVENTLGHAVQQAVEAGPFVGALGEQSALDLSFEPGVIELAAGAQVVVRAAVVIPAELAGERRGSVRVAGVPGAEIPILIRRLGS